MSAKLQFVLLQKSLDKGIHFEIVFAKPFLISASDDIVCAIGILESKIDWLRKSTYLILELI